MEIKHDPKDPDNRIAIPTGPKITAGAWFIFDRNEGGYYAADTDVADWTDGTLSVKKTTSTTKKKAENDAAQPS